MKYCAHGTFDTLYCHAGWIARGGGEPGYTDLDPDDQASARVDAGAAQAALEAEEHIQRVAAAQDALQARMSALESHFKDA